MRQGQATCGPRISTAFSQRPKDSEHEPLVNEVVLRTQAQAVYTPENIGHFGLNLRRYAHFTSPIRRYADLIVHRALIRALRLGAGRPDRTDMETRLPEIAERRSPPPSAAPWRPSATPSTGLSPHLARRPRRRDLPGRISGVTRAGLFVKLDETGADGFVPMSTLGSRLLRL